MIMRTLAVLTYLVAAPAVARSACELNNMVGNWRCEGSECPPGGAVSTVASTSSGYHYRDGAGASGWIRMDGGDLLIEMDNGTKFTPSLDAECKRMTFSPGRTMTWIGDQA
jgi:hypothetical protein